MHLWIWSTMRRSTIPARILSALLPIALALSLHAQVAAPSDTGTLTLRKNSHLVVLDVVVTDGKQNPIRGLKASNFIVLEKGKPQTIGTFDEHEPPPQATPLPMPKLPPNTFTNYTPAPQDGPVNVLLLDALNTPMKDQSYVRYQMLKFLDDMPKGTRIAIFGLTTHLRILQGFTSDPEILRAVLSGKKNLPNASVLLNDPVSGDYPGSDAFGTPDIGEVSANVSQFNAEMQSFQLQLRARYTLDAMNDLARYLSGIPGRKNLIWFSGSFPLDILPDGDLADPFSVVASAEDEFRQTTDMLTSSNVAVYPVDARGLMTPPMFSAANSGHQFARNPAALTNAIGMWGQQTAAEHDTMDAMADATGGKAFYNTNGLKEAVEKSISLGSHYYTITYTPSNDKWNGDYRSIKVKMADGSGYQLYYRHGYYADDPGKPAIAHAQAVPAPSAMGTAMLRGAPNPTQIIFEAYIGKLSPTPEAAPAIGNQPEPKLRGPYLSYTVNFGIDPRNIAFQATPDGVYHGSIEFVTLLYDADGTLLNSISNTMVAHMDTATYSAALQHGLQTSQIISVPVDPKQKREYYFRIGVHNVTGDRVGAIEVPVTAVHDESAPAVPAKQ